MQQVNPQQQNPLYRMFKSFLTFGLATLLFMIGAYTFVSLVGTNLPIKYYFDYTSNSIYYFKGNESNATRIARITQIHCNSKEIVIDNKKYPLQLLLSDEYETVSHDKIVDTVFRKTLIKSNNIIVGFYSERSDIKSVSLHDTLTNNYIQYDR